jgi:hypothetical protein
LVTEGQNLVQAIWDLDEVVAEQVLVSDPFALEILALVAPVTLVWASWKSILLGYVAFSREKENLHSYFVFVLTLVPQIPNLKTCLMMKKIVWLVQSFS